ncbi:bifunctional oligoribonuclease/PAP phosphatase NrnA [Patescibacteria group bacterium]
MNKIPHEKLNQIKELIDSNQRILILMHKRPDGDALGTGLALFLALKFQLGKEVFLLCRDEVPEDFRFLPSFFEIKQEIDLEKEKIDLVITVDVAEKHLLGLDDLLPAIFDGQKKTLNLDHHHTNPLYADINLVIQSSSTAEILFYLLEELELNIDSKIATCILAGIYTDTGSFQHQNVTPETFEVASKLILKGARLGLISRNVFNTKPVSRLRLWGRALSHIQRDQKRGVNVSVITQKDLEECGATLDDLEGVVSMINTVPDTKATILLSEQEKNEVKGSIRTESDDVDVSQIASIFGGGGHKKASGFSIPGRLERTGEGSWKIIR